MSEQAGSVPDWHLACAQIAIDFAVAIDHEDFERVLSLFTEDGSMDRFGQVSRGRAELRRWLFEERPKQLIRHVCSNFSGRMTTRDEVHGTTYFTAYRAMGRHDLPVTGTMPLMIGEWEDVFRRTDAGWRIRSRCVNVAFQA